MLLSIECDLLHLHRVIPVTIFSDDLLSFVGTGRRRAPSSPSRGERDSSTHRTNQS
jgi:hypothetical protein